MAHHEAHHDAHHDAHHEAHLEELHEHDRGLSHDLPVLLSRRRALRWFGGAGLAATLVGCGVAGGDSTDQGPAAPDTTTEERTDGGAGAASDGSEIPEETAGPYPGDGSNGVNVLTESGIVRSDITRSFGSASGVAQGEPLTITLTILDTGNGSAALPGAAVYLWHCDIDGRYSLYSEGITAENYLRGVQETGSDGSVTFTSIYPGAYAGRWPHIHLEVYPSLDAATTAGGKLLTSQLALPEDANSLVYATDGYSQSMQNVAQTSLDSDNVFSDGYALQLATVTGNADQGMVATLNVPV